MTVRYNKLSKFDCTTITSPWRHNIAKVSPIIIVDCLLNSLFRLSITKTSTPGILSLCERNTPVTDGFPLRKDQECGSCFHIMSSSWLDSVSITYETIYCGCCWHTALLLKYSRPMWQRVIYSICKHGWIADLYAYTTSNLQPISVPGVVKVMMFCTTEQTGAMFNACRTECISVIRNIHVYVSLLDIEMSP